MFRFLHNHYHALIQGLIRIRANWIGSVMMFLVIGITLSLPTTGFLLIQNASQISNKIQYEAELSIFLDKEIKAEQVDFLHSALKKNSLVKKIHFEPKLVAWEKLQAQLNLSSIEDGISKNPLPDAFFISLNTLETKKIDSFISDLKAIEGIEEIVLDGGWVKKLRSILYLIKIGIVILGCLLITVLVVVITNTVRLQTLTYQNEIEVSRLIGATNAFIQRPFEYTGLIYGLGGGLVTLVILKIILVSFNLVADRVENLIGGNITLNTFSVEQSIFIIIIAMFAGWIASYIAAKQAIHKLEKNY
ncbi:MAG: cell division protein FtsX [Methylophilaceae bacterium]